MGDVNITRDPLKEKFGVPENHTLVQTSYKAKGSWGQDETWTYNELDENGKIVGRYEERESGLTFPFKKEYEKLS